MCGHTSLPQRAKMGTSVPLFAHLTVQHQLSGILPMMFTGFSSNAVFK